MKPGQGKVLIVEDNFAVSRLLCSKLNKFGFETLSVDNRPEAEALIPRLGELGVGVALLDGNLSDISYRGADGIALNRAIKEAYGDRIKTIGISAGYVIAGADIEAVDITNFDGIVESVVQI